MDAVVGGGAVRFARPQHRDLLALLLLHANRALTMEQIIDGMWGGGAPATAVAQVQNMVSAIRKAVARGAAALATLDHRRSGYTLRTEARLIDLNCFNALVAEARGAATPELAIAVLRPALALWRGRPLADVRAAYVTAARVRLDDQRAAALEILFDAELAAGGHAEIVSEISDALAAHPFRERLVAQLVVALYRCDRQAEALAACRRTRRALADEQGLQPGPTLRKLESLVLRNDPALDLMPPAMARSPRWRWQPGGLEARSSADGEQTGAGVHSV
ncbi:AfsR/SARP family transcriptional regulator [Actinomycetes bacterium KLBMP 9797]